MRPERRVIGVLLVTFLLAGVLLAACSQPAAPAEQIEVTRIVEVPTEVEVEVPGPEVEVTRVVEVQIEAPSLVPEVPFAEEWAASPHNDAMSGAFTHWDEDDPAEVPTSCAKCHSTTGYIDFLGADGSEAGVVNEPAPLGTTVTCTACHNQVTATKDSVIFPSGMEVTGLGDESRCMECHQGRSSTVTVNQQIADAGLTDDVDTVSEDLGFSNIHYYAAAATQYGTLAMGGYEYDGLSYDARFDHVSDYNTCIECHDPHTLELNIEGCVDCHEGADSEEGLLDIRMAGSLVDYDGDGDIEEGIYYEIEGMREQLLPVMQAYATEVAGTPIVYGDGYPYFFIDTNGDGEAQEDEVAFPNAYNTWTPRLAKAAYNYQVSLKDPGRYAHGGKYIIQLMYDSIADLNQAVAAPVDLAALSRIDHGHFAGSEEAFRHWDGEEDGGIVSGRCSKCHTAEGLPQFITEGVNTSLPASNGLTCETCHNNVQEFTIYEVENVTFPSGSTVSFDDPASNLCIQCHQGRESGVSVANLIGDLEPDTVNERLRFLNIHYYAAGATLFGSEVNGGFQYPGLEYSGRFEHVNAFNTCVECHSVHALEVEVAECADCHENVETAEDLVDIRVSEVDYDGDGDVTEGIAGEVETMREALYAAIVDYSTNVVGTTIQFNPASYPYWFTDVNGNGMMDEGDERYSTWTPRLVSATYNFQDSTKDPGAYAHNASYVLQLLYDSVNDLGALQPGMVRPEVVVPSE